MPSIETIAAQDAILSLMAKHDTRMLYVFVPQSMSRHSTEKNHTLNWRISFSNARGALALDYSQGIGHVPNYREPPTLWDEELMGQPWESGYYNPRPDGSYAQRKKLAPPHAADILYSIALDASCIGQSFEEWASECGYSDDSRAAERIYHACTRQSEDARRILGRAFLDECAAILADY